MSITSVPSTQSPLSRKDTDSYYYQIWKQTGSKEDLGNLLRSLSPVIQSEVNRQSGTLPSAALHGQAQKWAVKAIQSYNPDKGVALATHVTGFLRKIRRVNYTYQNAARLPENLQLKYSEYSTAANRLENLLNRDPTEEELAKELGWSKAHVVRLKTSLYQDLSESGAMKPTEASQYNKEALVLSYIKENLTPDEIYILNHADDSIDSVSKHLGINRARYSYVKAKTRDKILELKQKAEAVYG